MCQKAATCLLFRRQSCWQHPPDLKHQFLKSILKVTRFVKTQTFQQLGYEFRTCFTSHKRLRNVCHSIGEINIILFLRVVL